MTRFFRPTLLRRIIAALVLAFLLVWSVLLGYQYIVFKQGMAQNSGLKQFGTALSSALEKIDNNTFGLCELCEKKISKVRLKAVPYAELCVPCQEKQEKKKK